MANDSQESIERKWLRTFCWIVAFVLIVQVGGYIGIQAWQGDQQRGSFGDMFGAINTLFSGLAFAALIVTVLMQREELKLQFEELEKSRKEFEKTAAAQQAILELTKSEKCAREARERRAATLTLYPWKRHDGDHHIEGIEAWRFSATNLGSMVTEVKVFLESGITVGGLITDPCPILPTEAKLSIAFTKDNSTTNWNGPENWPTATFRIEYVDTTGERRTQKYELQRNWENLITCIDLGTEQSE
ncbi:MAG: hypothetical protein JNK74_06100 [Candidatus Hydrogenedentes bacterium]|nr:hypothetical protein [Candidatus Hydrogenedentota bacterium]